MKIKYSKFNGLCKKRIECDGFLITITRETFMTDAKAWIINEQEKVISINPNDIIKAWNKEGELAR